MSPEAIDEACARAFGQKNGAADEPPDFRGQPKVGAGANMGPAQGGMRNRNGAHDAALPGAHIDFVDGFHGTSDAASMRDRAHHLQNIANHGKAKIAQDGLLKRAAAEGASEAAFKADLPFIRVGFV
jgi:hypothetical protein